MRLCSYIAEEEISELTRVGGEGCHSLDYWFIYKSLSNE